MDFIVHGISKSRDTIERLPLSQQSCFSLWGWDSVPRPHPKAVLEGLWGRQCPAPVVQVLLSSWRCSEPLSPSHQPPLAAAHNCPHAPTSGPIALPLSLKRGSSPGAELGSGCRSALRGSSLFLLPQGSFRIWADDSCFSRFPPPLSSPLLITNKHPVYAGE